MLNLSPLFFTTIDGDSCMHNALELSDTQRACIADARMEVRNCLRAGIPRVLKNKGYTEDVPQPRFFTQGSWAYKTLNSPAQNPQQADVDDGCYLPLSFVSQTKRPSAAATVFFNAAEEALSPLVKQNGWKLITEKSTCIRIVIASYAHIDIPLYAIPDHEFVTLAKASMELYGYAAFDEAVRKAERDAWTALPRDKVLLAHRDLNWIASDPRPIKEWFLAEVDAKGEQLRRIIRYLKAFRDWKWSSGGPSSILLMAAVAPLFEKYDRRDDLALLNIVAQLPERLRAGVYSPIDEAESLTKRLGEEGVEEAAKTFEEFEKMLRGAVDASNPAQACIWMRREFGPRFPNEPDRIKLLSLVAAASALPLEAIATELNGRKKAG